MPCPCGRASTIRANNMDLVINNLELRAMRQALGLSVVEACEFIKNPKGESINKRHYRYLESGDRKIAYDVNLVFYNKATRYTLLLDLLNRDIDQFKKENPLPETDDTDEYFEKMKTVKKLVLPFFNTFEVFETETGNSSTSHWRMWQAVVGHLLLIGKIDGLDDEAKIPSNFQCVHWLNGDFNETE